MQELKIKRTHFDGFNDLKRGYHQNVFQQLKKEKLPKHQSFAQILKEIQVR